MKKIDITNWKEFEISNIFDIVKGTRLTKANMHKGNINFVGASAINNGITCKIGNTEHLHPAGTITVSYNGSVGEAFYQTEVFWASDDINVLYPKFPMNHYIALFILPIIKQIGKHYAFVDKWKKDDMEKDTIPLPILKDNTPNWQYMENYMRQIEQRQRANLQIINDLLPPPIANKALNKLSTKNWKSFRIGDLFEIKNGKGITKQEIFENPGNIPAIQSGEENFGRIGYIDIKYCLQKKYTISLGECLTVARSGSSGFVGYQEKQCVVGDSAKILEPKFISNTLRLLFIRTMLMVNKARYAYTDKVTKDNYAKDTIKLPVLSDGTPDWTYMEQYITMLMDKQARNLKQLA